MRKWVFNFLVGIVFIFAMFGILSLDVYVHEKAHVKVASEEGVCFKIKEIGWKPSIKNLRNLGSGKAVPVSKEECEKFNSLPIEKKKRITHAGVKAEVALILPLLCVSAFLFIFFFRKFQKFRNSKTILIFSLLWMVLLVLIILFTLKNNVFTQNPEADWNLLNFPNCSRFSSI